MASSTALFFGRRALGSKTPRLAMRPLSKHFRAGIAILRLLRIAQHEHPCRQLCYSRIGHSLDHNSRGSTWAQPGRRSFAQSAIELKKKNKADSSDGPANGGGPSSVNVEDFSIFQKGYEALSKHLKESITKLDNGGRFNPEVVEQLKVQVGDKEDKQHVKLSDLAQVVPRGRLLNIIVGDREHIKAISSALLASNLSLNPQQDPHTPTQLNVPLPPPTAEARQQASKAVTQLGETALNAVRQARQAQRTLIQDAEKKKTALADDAKRALKKLENEVQKANDEVKKVVSDVKKKLDRGS